MYGTYVTTLGPGALAHAAPEVADSTFHSTRMMFYVVSAGVSSYVLKLCCFKI